eukprot:s632_g28.t2
MARPAGFSRSCIENRKLQLRAEARKVDILSGKTRARTSQRRGTLSPGMLTDKAARGPRAMRSLALNRLWGSESADAGTAAPDAVANSDARVVQLEAALAEERRRSVQKDEELQKMQKLMAKLESHIEQQAKDSDQEHKRLSSLETVISQKREAGAEESDKVKRLVLALAETKRLKEIAEKTAIDEGERASRLERQISDMKKTDFFSADMQPVANSNNAEEDWELQRLREECAAEQQKREDLTGRCAGRIASMLGAWSRGPVGNMCNIYMSRPFGTWARSLPASQPLRPKRLQDAEVCERMQRAKMEQLETQLP